MKKLIVFAAHDMTASQLEGWDEVIEMKNFPNPEFLNIPPTTESASLKVMAKSLVSDAMMLGATHISFMGEPCLMWHVANECPKWDIQFVQATTERVSKDIPQEDGSIKKISVFSHVMWREWYM